MWTEEFNRLAKVPRRRRRRKEILSKIKIIKNNHGIWENSIHTSPGKTPTWQRLQKT